MAASKMRFSRSGHPGTRQSRPTHPAESPKRRGQATGGARNTDLPAGWSLLTTPKRTVLKRNWIGQLVNPSESMVCGS